MNQPIRNIPELVAAMRAAQIERELSNETLEDVAGLASGHVDKILGRKIKGLGEISLPLMLGGLGKALALVDDPEQINRVKGRWTKRRIVGGSAMQMAAQACRSSITSEMQEMPVIQAQLELRERMKVLGKLGGLKGGKRRAKVLGKRARQRIASHAARKRWEKHAKC